MCDRAGVDALWVSDPLAHAGDQPRLEAWTALILAGLDACRPRVGVTVNVALRPPTVLAAMAGTLDVALGGRLELGFGGGWLEREHRTFGFEFPEPPARVSRVEAYATIMRQLLAGDSVSAAGPNAVREARLGVASPQPGGPPLSVEAAGPLEVGVAARVADDVVIRATAVKDIGAAVAQVRAGCEAAGRDPSSLGIAVELPVSIGRTSAEAEARARSEALFRYLGHPSKVGVFGTLEQCQDRVIELAHAGVTDLRCILPNTPDVHDVIAQLTAMVVGTVAVLTPNSPRSKPPDPPEGWGGRPRVAT